MLRIINTSLEKTSKGDDYVKCELDNGHSFNVFQFHPRYGEFRKLVDSEKKKAIEKDELHMTQDGKYINLNEGDDIPDDAKPVDFDAIEERKEKEATRTEYSIKLSSTANKAAEVLAAEIAADHLGESKKTKQDRWKMWRRFFWDQWEHPEDYTDPDDIID